jgi:hypothetical protein
MLLWSALVVSDRELGLFVSKPSCGANCQRCGMLT